MATAVLGVVGGAIGGSGALGGSAIGAALGTAIGGAVGAYIDQALILPALFPQTLKGPRANSFPAITGGEGSPANFPIGRSIRVPLTIIWASEVRETRRRQKLGGKGGGGAEQKTYHYHQDCAYHVASRPIQRIKKIFAEGNVVYESDGSTGDGHGNHVDVTGTVQFDAVGVIEGAGIGGNVIVKNYTDVFPASGEADDLLAGLVTGSQVSISGATNGANNGSWFVWSKRVLPTGVTVVRLANPSGVDEGPTSNVRFVQDSEGFQPGIFSGPFLYHGDQTTADPVIQAKEGANTPAFVGDSYVVFQQLSLDRFGKRLPFMEAIIQADTFTTLDQAFLAILTRGEDFTAADFDVSAISGISFEGYNWNGVESKSTVIGQLMQFYDVVAQLRGGVLHFFPAASRQTIVLSESDLAANEPGASGEPRDLEITDNPNYRQPREVAVEYLDTSQDLNKGQERYKRNFGADGATNVSAEIASNSSEAREVAKRVLWDSDASRQIHRIMVPANATNLRLLENDITQVVSRGRTYRFVNSRVNRAEDGLVELIGPKVRADIDADDPANGYLYQPASPGEDPQGHVEDRIPICVPLQLDVIDLAPLRDEDTTRTGIYYAAAALDPSAAFLGGALYLSLDGGTNYEEVAEITVEAVMGTVKVSPTNATPTPRSVDASDTIDVEIFNGELESATDAEVRNGANAIKIGNEILGFRTATLISGPPAGQAGYSVYRISNLYRGMRGTEINMDQHAVGTLCTLLTFDGLRFLPIPARYIGGTIKLKAVAEGCSLADMPEQSFTFNSGTVVPFVPVISSATNDGANKVTVTWQRQTRAESDPLILTEEPVISPPETYKVRFTQGTSVVKTVTDARTISYTAAEQTTDGFTPGSGYTIDVWEVHRIGGDGPEAQTTV